MIAHRRIRQPRRTVLVDEPGQDAPRGIALLFGSIQIAAQHGVDRGLERLQPWRYPLRDLPPRQIADPNAWRTVRRCTPYLSASESPRTAPPSTSPSSLHFRDQQIRTFRTLITVKWGQFKPSQLPRRVVNQCQTELLTS